MLKVFEGLVEFESSGQNFYTQLSDLNSSAHRDREVLLQGVKPAELKAFITNPSLSEAKIASACRLLAEDAANIVKETKDGRSQQGLYAINWLAGYNSVKAALVDQIITNSYGRDHSQVVRVLRQKGFVEEKELVKMCCLP